MGIYAEIWLQLDWKEEATEEDKLKLHNEIKELKHELNPQGLEDDYSQLFLFSDRYQNLDYQLEEVLTPILKKHTMIESITGNIMTEGSGFSYYSEDGE